VPIATRLSESHRDARKVEVHDDVASSSSAQVRELRANQAKAAVTAKAPPAASRNGKPAVRKQLSKNLKRDIKLSVTSGDHLSRDNVDLNDGGRHGEDSEISFSEDGRIKNYKVLLLLKAYDSLKTEEFLNSVKGQKIRSILSFSSASSSEHGGAYLAKDSLEVEPHRKLEASEDKSLTSAADVKPENCIIETPSDALPSTGGFIYVSDPMLLMKNKDYR